MEKLMFVLQIVALLFVFFVIVRIWMMVANRIGEDIRLFFVELWKKVTTK